VQGVAIDQAVCGEMRGVVVQGGHTIGDRVPYIIITAAKGEGCRVHALRRPRVRGAGSMHLAVCVVKGGRGEDHTIGDRLLYVGFKSVCPRRRRQHQASAL
jgi:hypothetical protein